MAQASNENDSQHTPITDKSKSTDATAFIVPAYLSATARAAAYLPGNSTL
jgi:hypothetical protein